MKSLHIFFLLLFVLVIVTSCTKEKNASCFSGFIYWGGDYAVDGIGFYFAESRQGNWKFKQLKENELTGFSKSAVDSTAVYICLEETTERAPCFCSSPSNFYKIVSVEKR
jgi:hypothetical protein